jgi:hypothetical protein
MNWGKLLGYGVLAVVVLLVLQVVLSLVLSLFGLLWAVVTTAGTLLAVVGLFYGMYRLLSWASTGGDDASAESVEDFGSATTSPEPETRVETLKDRYASGNLSEAELERRLEQELDTPTTDDLGRDVHRERE